MYWDFVFKAAQSFGTIALGGGALLIAYLKWKDDREKIKNELWQQRFEIYQQALYSLNSMKIHGIENWTETVEFKTALHKAKYAFPDSGPYKLMEEIWSIWYEFKIPNRRIGTAGHDAAVKELERIDARFRKIDLDAAFSKHLARRF